ncbi:MAG TPA: hypothetical protein QF753_18550 [Victivallales bacterium]|nr:hypothetical protein [Victivallales bacterium]
MFKRTKFLAITACVFGVLFSVTGLFGTEFTGTAQPLITSTMHFGSNASFNTPLKYVAKEGSFIKPAVLDDKGKTVVKGTILAELDITYWKAMAESNKSAVLAAEQEITTAKQNLVRYQDLTRTKEPVAAVQTYQTTQETYAQALSAYQEAIADLVETEQVIKAYTLKAPFEGIVDKVYLTHGLASAIPTVIQVSQLNPMGIKIVMTREQANQINAYTPITVSSPVDNSQVNIDYGSVTLTKDGILVQVPNSRVYGDTIEYKGNKVPVLRDYSSISKFYVAKNSKVLGIEKSAILKDKSQNYVWKADPVGKGYFTAKKININLMNLNHIVANGIVEAAKSDNLALNDILLMSVPKTLKDGDIVFCPAERYIFMPGDKVNVKIGTQVTGAAK